MTNAPHARPHHQRFSHQALPKVILSGPPKMLELISSPMATPFLMDIWESVGKEVPKADRMEPDGLRVTTHELGERKATVVQMPAPTGVGESFFVAFVTKPAGRRMVFLKTKATLRCFTLDRAAQGTSLSEIGEDGTVLSTTEGPRAQLQDLLGSL